MLKALREAKVHTTWAAPNPTYEDAALDFIRYALDVSRPNAFLDSFAAFAARAAPLGLHNSLVQTVLKMTVPGVPDIYQGAELWDFSLVDPDNRRPVDYAARRALLERDASGAADLAEMMTAWHDGRIKLHLVRALLGLRRRLPELFASGSYEALNATGEAAERICAFARHHGEVSVVVVASLFPTKSADGWSDEAVPLPGDGAVRWTSLFDGRSFESGSTAAAELFGRLPVAVLVRAT